MDDNYNNSNNDNDNDNEMITESRKNKRVDDDDERQTDFDDIMSLITSKMDALTTSSEDVSKDEIIAIFMQVLECTDGEAVFFLESSGWSMEVAVQLKFEADDSQYFATKRGRTFGSKPFLDPVFQETGRNKFVARECNMEGLPEGWRAVVSRCTGTIYFVNDVLKLRQSQVPHGFADAVHNDDNDNEEMSDNNNNNNNNNNIDNNNIQKNDLFETNNNQDEMNEDT